MSSDYKYATISVFINDLKHTYVYIKLHTQNELKEILLLFLSLAYCGSWEAIGLLVSPSFLWLGVCGLFTLYFTWYLWFLVFILGLSRNPLNTSTLIQNSSLFQISVNSIENWVVDWKFSVSLFLPILVRYP